jgi:gluconate/galactonate dehydratase
MEIIGIQTVVVEGNFDWPLIRIDTDAGVSGYGEIRDAVRPYEEWHPELAYVDDPTALVHDLEPHVIGMNPTDVRSVVDAIRPYGGWGRLGGGVSAIEMACWDITGKDLGVPVWQLIGGKGRDEVRVYCDCRAGHPVADSATDYALDGNDYTPAGYAEHAEQREREGFDSLKFDLNPGALEHVDGTHGLRNGSLTRAGLDYLVEVVEAVRGAVAPDTDVGFDCFSMRDLPLADAIRFARAVEEYDLAYLEDIRHDDDLEGWRELTARTDTPTMTGEDLYTVDSFRALVSDGAVRLVGPDLLTVGGIRETVRVAEFAGHHGLQTSLHFAASPVGFVASLHAAAAIEDLLGLEFHAVGVPWWGDLVESPDPLFEDGYATVPEAPGLGVELDESVVRAHATDENPWFQ